MKRGAVLAGVILAACGESGGAPADAPDAVGLEAGLGMLRASPPELEGDFVAGDLGWSVTITNTGNAPTAPLSTALTGPDASGFGVLYDTCRGFALADGASCEVAIAASCSYPVNGFRDAVLEIAGMPGGSVSVPIHMRINAKSCIPVLFPSPGSHNFGDHVVDVQSSSFRFTISNAGGKASTPLLHTLAGNHPEEFRIIGSTCAGAMVQPGGTCTFDVVFYPRTLGAKYAQIITSSPTTSNTVSVTGTGVSPASGPP